MISGLVLYCESTSAVFLYKRFVHVCAFLPCLEMVNVTMVQSDVGKIFAKTISYIHREFDETFLCLRAFFKIACWRLRTMARMGGHPRTLGTVPCAIEYLIY